MPHQDRLNIAVFIDFDNIEIGVKNTLGQQFDAGTILDAIKERGEVVTKIAYADWTRAGEYSRALTQHAIRLVQRNLTPGGDKNGADINLALDALEMVFTHEHINAYVIVGGDSDFLSLVEKLKQYDKKVFVVGGRQFTSMILQRNCHEFIAYENLGGVRRSATRGGRPIATPTASPLPQAFPIVRRALKLLAEREVSAQAGLLKSTLLQLDSTFSERNYGASSFFDFIEKLSRAGVVSLRNAGRSQIVELNEGFESDGAASAPAMIEAGTASPMALGDQAGADGVTDEQISQPPTDVPRLDAPRFDSPPVETHASGVQRAGRILSAANARWPMYLRNVKQILRQAEGGFDERRYGFGGLIDLLKACQRDGLVRIERDHRGGLRVFQGHALRSVYEPTKVTAPVPDEAAEVVEATPVDTAPADAVAVDESVAPATPGEDVDESSGPGNERVPIAIDTTANRLGRAQPRKPRIRALRPLPVTPLRPPGRGAPAKSAAKKAAPARKSGRGRKATASDSDS